jgi:hypothetical protein
MRRVTAQRASDALRREYPGADVRVRREFGGGVSASVFRGTGTMCFAADGSGVLAALLGLDVAPGTPDGGESADERLTA